MPSTPSNSEPGDRGSEPFRGGSAPVSAAVSEYVAARRVGLSVDTLRRDRRLGHLGIPFIKLGEGKRGLVRYDLADLDRWVETKKRAGRATTPQAAPLPPSQPVEPPAPEPDLPEPQPRRSPPRTPWEALAERVQAETEDDPFATGRPAPRRPGGYWSR